MGLWQDGDSVPAQVHDGTYFRKQKRKPRMDLKHIVPSDFSIETCFHPFFFQADKEAVTMAICCRTRSLAAFSSAFSLFLSSRSRLVFSSSCFFFKSCMFFPIFLRSTSFLTSVCRDGAEQTQTELLFTAGPQALSGPDLRFNLFWTSHGGAN